MSPSHLVRVRERERERERDRERAKEREREGGVGEGEGEGVNISCYTKGSYQDYYNAINVIFVPVLWHGAFIHGLNDCFKWFACSFSLETNYLFIKTVVQF